MWKKEYLTIFLIMVTEVLGFSLILPFLPFYIQDLGGTAFTVGIILTIFSLLQFISAPVMGKLSDTYGRKPLLMMSQFSTFLGFVILGFARSIPVIALSRAVDGLLGSNGVIAQSYLSDVSTKKERSKIYGISGAAAGFGFLIGPAAGGALAKINFALPAFIAAGLSFTTIIMTNFLLKETVVNHHKKKLNLNSAIKEINPVEIMKNFQEKNLRLPLMILFSFILMLTVFVSNFTLFGERQFHLRVDMVGYLLAYVGLISIVIRGVILSNLIDRFSETRLANFSFICTIISLLMATFLHGFFSLLAAITLFSLGIGLLRPMLLGEISRNADDNRQGEVLGLTGSLTSMAQIVGPIMGGFVLTYISYSSLPIISMLIILIGFYLYHVFTKKKALFGEINRADGEPRSNFI